jgi:PAS domain S-box-containing protein
MLRVKRMLDGKAALALGAWIGYVLVFIPLYRLAVGEITLALAVLPVILTAALYGVRAGVLTSLLSFPLNLLLVTLIGGTLGEMMTWRGLIGSALILVLGLVTGRMRDLGEQVKGELADRRQAESHRDATLKALRESEERYRSLFESMPVGLYRSTPAGQILDANPAVLRMLDYPNRESLLAVNVDDTYTNVEDRRRWQALLEQDGMVRDLECRFRRCNGTHIWEENNARRKDGRPYDAAMTIAPVFDANDRHVGHVCSHQDISGRVELDRARARFMTNVSHELRTPLTNLQLYAKLLREGGRPEKAERYHQVLQEQAKRLGDLIQDMLEMATLDGGKAMAAWKAVPLPSLVGDAINRYQDHATAAGLSLLARTVPAGLRPVQGDQARLGQALAEVVENAVTFTPAGGQVMVEVSPAEEEGEDWVTISVRDTGPGMSAEEQEAVFDRFFRGKLAESGHVPGTGLGLSMAQEILRAHGGRITVESRLGEGATFTLWLRGALPETT